MFAYKREIPEGMEDTCTDKRWRMANVEDELKSMFSRSGYWEVHTPTLEYYDVFASMNGALEQEKMVKFLDSKGRILVLRPDMTTPIARMVATKFKEDSFPARLCYNANVFRADYGSGEGEREFTQSGVELLGIQDPTGDAEVLNLAIRALLSLGIKDFQIDIGHNGFFRAVIERLDIDQGKEQELQRIIETKNMVALDELLSEFDGDGEMKGLVKALPFMFGNPRDVLKELEEFQLDSVMERELSKLKSILAALEDYGVAKYAALDFGLVSEMSYYTGLIFRGLIKDVGYTVLSGGRYDNLVGNFGMDCPAVGFAINVNRLVEAMEVKGMLLERPVLDYRVIFDDDTRQKAYTLAEGLREKGKTVELSQGMFNRDGAAYVLSLVSNVELRVVDCSTGLQREDNVQRFLNRAGLTVY